MMKTSLRMSVVAGLAAFLVSFGATAAEKTFNIGGDAEYDMTWGKTTFSDGGSAGVAYQDTSVKNTNEGGRVQLKAKARIDNDWGSFVEAVAAPRFYFRDGKQSDSQGDQYIKFGKKTWDIQLGRFEGIDLFPLGKDTVFTRASSATAPTGYNSSGVVVAPYTSGGLGYQADYGRGRDGNGTDNNDGRRIQGAAHFNVRKTQVELGLGYADSDGVKSTTVRPVVKFDAGRFRVAAGYDMRSCKSSTNTSASVNCGSTSAGVGYETNNMRGFGITAGTTVGKIDANFNIAQGKSKTTTFSGVSTTGNKMTSIGLNGSRGRFGAGYVHDKTSNVGKQDSLYAAYTVPLMGSKDATVTFAANTSKAKYDNGDRAKNNSLRARFNYNF